ncbi:unnamed protein product, partial [Mesorhabditis spiculigera]
MDPRSAWSINALYLLIVLLICCLSTVTSLKVILDDTKNPLLAKDGEVVTIIVEDFDCHFSRGITPLKHMVNPGSISITFTAGNQTYGEYMCCQHEKTTCRRVSIEEDTPLRPHERLCTEKENFCSPEHTKRCVYASAIVSCQCIFNWVGKDCTDPEVSTGPALERFVNEYALGIMGAIIFVLVIIVVFVGGWCYCKRKSRRNEPHEDVEYSQCSQQDPVAACNNMTST